MKKIKYFSSLKIVDLFLLFLYAVKPLKESFSNQRTNFSKKTIFCVSINQAFDFQTLVNISFFQLCVASICLLSVIHIQISKVLFSGMSKAFDRVWYGRLIHKIKYVGINGMLLKLISFFGKQISKSSFKWSNIMGNRAS